MGLLRTQAEGIHWVGGVTHLGRGLTIQAEVMQTREREGIPDRGEVTERRQDPQTRAGGTAE